MSKIKKLLLSGIIVLSMIAPVWAQQKSTAVFISGNEGHKSYRIPAIIDLPNGHLLAFAEGRVHGSGDYGDVNIVLKRSSDKGKTWGALQTVVDYDVLQAGNPAPVVDLTDPTYPQGRIFLFYNTGNNHENEVRKGNGLREVWYRTSVDGGATWGDPVNITTQTHKPLNIQANVAYNFTEEWRSYANTPGHAMQFQTGQYRGRIFVAANHSVDDPKRDATDYVAHGFYTDDHGKSFHISDNLNIPGSNESIAAEISGGRLMFNSRNQKGDVRARIVAISGNGGQSWDSTYFDRNLPDPVCQGTILTLGSKKGKSILAFCNAADEKKRNNLTLRISYDDGKTWVKNFVIYNNPEKNDAAAYSDIVKIGKNSIGILFEKDGYSQIVFITQKWK